MPRTVVAWFRRDLRVHDHPALVAAVAGADAVVPLFVLDDHLLARHADAANRRWFMRESLVALSEELAERGASLRVARGRPVEVVERFAREAGADAVYVTRDASPYGRSRDREVAAALARHGIGLHEEPGQYVHAPDGVAKADGTPFRVFTPYHRTWAALPRRDPLPAPVRIPGPPGTRRDDIPDLGPPSADPALIPAPGEPAARDRLCRWLDGGLETYHGTRNRLDLEGTSRLSQDLRFGLLSVTEVASLADRPGEGPQAFVRELAWRDFYAHVLWHQPDALGAPFQAAFRAMPWRDDRGGFAAWAEGRTGYPVVDAAMRQLRATGFLPNRARMIVASFLAKDLLIDPRLGEAEFMRRLTDGDPASNDGGWQWSAGTGTDPQPFVRVFNPVLQGRRFDPDGDYVRRWVPELGGIAAAAVHEPWSLPADERRALDYPDRIVDHAAARERALAVFASIGRRRSAGGD
jgi:deoxyribodipyrimidine photo-lyase